MLSCTLFIDLNTKQTIIEYVGDEGDIIRYEV